LPDVLVIFHGLIFIERGFRCERSRGMSTVDHRLSWAAFLTFVFMTAAAPAFAQIDFSGEWAPIRAEESHVPIPTYFPAITSDCR